MIILTATLGVAFLLQCMIISNLTKERDYYKNRLFATLKRTKGFKGVMELERDIAENL